ncbi:hypothetical protein N8208_08160, partial [Planktomarina temperata]|nr:hypothetical protein [Planktomarina temperata]
CITACQSKHVCSDAQAGGRVADVDPQIKYQITEFYAVLRHFVSLSVSLRIAHRLQYLAMYLILWCPHTAPNRYPWTFFNEIKQPKTAVYRY